MNIPLKRAKDAWEKLYNADDELDIGGKVLVLDCCFFSEK
jgi:hypothetical protein